jgi:hypothetical protein
MFYRQLLYYPDREVARFIWIVSDEIKRLKTLTAEVNQVVPPVLVANVKAPKQLKTQSFNNIPIVPLKTASGTRSSSSTEIS